jgi:integrase
MGAIYRPKYKGADGLVRESAVYWIRFRQHGRTERQSTGTTSIQKATAVLRQQEGKVALKIPVDVQADRLTLTDGAALIRAEYTANGRKSLNSLEPRLAHLLAQLGAATRLSRLTSGTVEAYKTARLEAGAAPATINRELAALGRIAALARHQYGFVVPFVGRRLEERNVRQGFFDADAVRAIAAALPPHLAALAEAARLTGWRKSELRSRQWRHVDVDHGWLRLEPEETKNRKGRQFPLVPALRALLEAQRARGEAIQKTTGRLIPWIFCREDGQPAGDFKRAWATACIKAGFYRVEPVRGPDGTPVLAKDGTPVVVKKPTRLFHDFRRTAARDLIRAGIPEIVAMNLTGHLTNSVFKRYAIVDEAMLTEAGQRLTASSKVTRETGKVVRLDR